MRPFHAAALAGVSVFAGCSAAPATYDAATPGDAALVDATHVDTSGADGGAMLPREMASLTVRPVAPGDFVGGVVALAPDATLALVGVYSPMDTCCGIVVAFAGADATWNAGMPLSSPAEHPNDSFGAAVAIDASGTRALVGAPTDRSTYFGNVRVFERSGDVWSEEALLQASSAAVGYFGAAVSLGADGSVALIGAPEDDFVAPSAGSARVFVRSGATWAEEAILLASDASAGDGLGHAVSLSADATRALVGAHYDAAASASNVARVFARSGSTWREEAALLPGDARSDDVGSISVALSGDGTRALVGASNARTTGGITGNAHVFVRTGTTWTEEATLLPADATEGDQLGISVALSADGSRALVGANRDDAGGPVSGSVRVFVRSGTTWMETSLLAGRAGEGLGTSVALSGDGTRALVGAPFGGGEDGGRAVLFALGP